MKKELILGVFSATLVLTSCGGLGGNATSNGSNAGGNIFGSGVGETIGNVISSVIGGASKLSEEKLYGTWRYDGPGCAFTSESVLARVGGEVAASKVEEKLATEYNKLGFTASNTQLTFDKNGKFSAKIKGKTWNGTYTYDASDSSLELKGLLLNLNAMWYATERRASACFLSRRRCSPCSRPWRQPVATARRLSLATSRKTMRACVLALT